jgi:hypothetical protein
MTQPSLHTPLTEQLLSVHKSYSTGNNTHNGLSSSQVSNQKLTFLPLCTTNFLPLRYRCLTFNMSFHTGESDCLGLIKHKGVSFTYFILTKSCHKPSHISNNHYHLQSKLIFINLRFFIPNPLQILDHLTK